MRLGEALTLGRSIGLTSVSEPRMGASGESGPRWCAARCVVGIRRRCRFGQRRSGPRSASGPALRHQCPAVGSGRGTGWLGRRCCRAVADASGGGHRGRTCPADSRQCARRCHLYRDRHGLHPRHRHRACLLAAPVLDPVDQVGDRLQCGGLSGPDRGRVAPFHSRANWLSLRHCALAHSLHVIGRGLGQQAHRRRRDFGRRNT